MLYFDNAATTYPKPASVLRAAACAITSYGGNPGRAGHNMAMRVSEKIYLTRCLIGEFFCCEPQNVVFTQNCTMSLNMAIKGLFSQGGHVLCSCMEHNSVLRPLTALKNENKLDFDIIYEAGSDDEIVKAFSEKIRPETKGIICTAGSNVTGKLFPTAALGALCKSKNILFVVDAAQSGGVLEIDMEKCNINALCMPGHKGLYGIAGSGLLLLRECPAIQTIFEGGTGSLSISPEQPDFMPDRLEAGTLNTVGILALNAGMNFIKKNGISNIYEHEYMLCKKVYDGLANMENVTLYQGNYEYRKYLPIVAFNICGVNSDITVAALNEKGNALRGGLHCAPLTHAFYGTQDCGMARFSPSIFNKEAEIVQFLKNVWSVSKKVLI